MTTGTFRVPRRSQIEHAVSIRNSRNLRVQILSDDRAFLIAVHDRVRAAVGARPLSWMAIHGDAGAHNVFITAEGALYTDFEDVCLGPREWDIGYFGDVDLALFEPVDRSLFWLLSDLRSVCVAVWCFQQYAWPEKREAAEYHLGYLKEKGAPLLR